MSGERERQRETETVLDDVLEREKKLIREPEGVKRV